MKEHYLIYHFAPLLKQLNLTDFFNVTIRIQAELEKPLALGEQEQLLQAYFKEVLDSLWKEDLL